ncbi:hypothetical protein CR513_32052, partial [Mucuna pruriens]
MQHKAKQWDLKPLWLLKVYHRNKKVKEGMVGSHEDHYSFDEDPPKRTLQDYSILVIETSSFKLKPTLISMMQNVTQFRGLYTEEPLTHLKKINNVPKNNIFLRLFPFSLANKALKWLTTFLDGIITTWDECTQKLLLKYFPLSKSNKEPLSKD